MKDSRLGTFGVLALGIGIALKVFALAALAPVVAAAALIAAHAGGRFAAISVMAFLPYAGNMSTAKAKPLATSVTGFGLAFAACFGLPPVFLLPFAVGLTACLAGFAAALFMAWRAKRLLGGFTGDVLGAIEQSYEIAFLLECEPQALSEAVLKLGDLAKGSRVFVSPAKRARDLASRLTTRMIVDDRLQELNFGDWEGRRWLDLGRDAIDAWHQGLPDSAPPNGETLTAMAARCASWLNSLQPGESPIFAVTHAGPIRLIKSILNGEPLLTYFTNAIPFAEPIELRLPDD